MLMCLILINNSKINPFPKSVFYYKIGVIISKLYKQKILQSFLFGR